MNWIVYSVVLHRFGRAYQQIKRAPVLQSSNPTLAAEALGGTLLSVQRDLRRAESLRRLTEMQAVIAGHNVAEWSPPEEWTRETPRSLPQPRLRNIFG